jgi:hypothetical protein
VAGLGALTQIAGQIRGTEAELLAQSDGIHPSGLYLVVESALLDLQERAHVV